MVLTEQVLCSNATAFFGGIASRSGGGSFCRNLSLAVGLPRGAKDGLNNFGDASCPGLLEALDEPSPPSPIGESAINSPQIHICTERIYKPSR